MSQLDGEQKAANLPDCANAKRKIDHRLSSGKRKLGAGAASKNIFSYI
jgi:hypothetical protein